MNRYVFGLKCKLGDGYDEKLWRIIKFNGKSKKIDTENIKNICTSEVFEISATILLNYPLGLYLEDSVLKILDFFIIYDEQQYYRFSLMVSKKIERCDEFDKYPENTGYHVNQVIYGIYMEVIIPQTLFPQSIDKIKKLLKSALKNMNVLTEEQKKVECKVLINTTETRTMTLEQVFNFKDEFLAGKHDEYQTIVNLGIKKHKELKSVNVKNELNFRYFLSDLYICYRKIELKLEENEHPVTQIKRNHDLSVEAVLANLQNAKAEFKETNKNDFMRMYSIMKNLFYKYLDYLKFFMDHRLDMDEGDDLPVNWKDFKLRLKKLNDWEPNKMIYPSTNQFSMTFISFINKYENITLQIDDTITEPMITVKNQHNKLFGIIKIRNPETMDENSATATAAAVATVMELPCPMKCSPGKRIWFCYVCGEIVKNHGMYTICGCGQEIFNKNGMICSHPKHQQDVSIKELPSDLRSIVYQLKKYEVEHAKLKDAVEIIIDMSYNDDLMKETIQGISNLSIPLDGDTRNLINEYLKK